MRSLLQWLSGTLRPNRGKIGIMFGAGGAIVLRVGLTIVVAQLLGIKGLKFCGGVLIMWIALKLFIEGAPEEGAKKEPKTIWQAMVTIVIADIVMSLDNMLAVAGASHGNNFLIHLRAGVEHPLCGLYQ